jgi:hypothetical protein
MRETNSLSTNVVRNENDVVDDDDDRPPPIARTPTTKKRLVLRLTRGNVSQDIHDVGGVEEPIEPNDYEISYVVFFFVSHLIFF